ncbi:uncharacterized protein RJT20DRAFT_128135 [Scheffersomyces xylosifermentans]|uniref:uncharacterized protein n=1 Tax=Scheffersomyces xylosifermentans TaxID=1304137 RepID=UPI00315CA581
MYFSGYSSDDFCTISDDGVELNERICDEIEDSDETKFRVSLDMPMPKLEIGLPYNQRLRLRSRAILGLDVTPSLCHVDYISNMLINAEFCQMSADEFKATYLAPFEVALKATMSKEAIAVSGNARVILLFIDIFANFYSVLDPLED